MAIRRAKPRANSNGAERRVVHDSSLLSQRSNPDGEVAREATRKSHKPRLGNSVWGDAHDAGRNLDRRHIYLA